MSNDASYASQPPARSHGSGMAITALVLGIIAVLSSITVIGGILFGLLALIFGIIGRGRARAGGSGGGMAITGAVLGVVGIILAIVLIAVGVSIFNNHDVKNYRACLKDAGNDQQKTAQCAKKFNRAVNNKNG